MSQVSLTNGVNRYHFIGLMDMSTQQPVNLNLDFFLRKLYAYDHSFIIGIRY